MKIFLEKPYLLALTIFTAMVVWLLSGQSAEVAVSKPPTTTVVSTKPLPILVQVNDYKAESLSREVVITGHTASLRTVTLRAEIDSKVVTVGATRGARVKPGEMIIRLATEERDLRLQEAQTLVEQRQLEYEAKKSLSQKGYQSQTQIAEALTLLESSKTQVKQAKLALENTVINAPFAGVLVQRLVEEGDYVSKGNPIAEIMDEDPFLVVGEVNELQRPYLQLEQPATAKLVTGETVIGKISLIAMQAESATRTFLVEVEIPNPEGKIVAGLTAEIRIPLNLISAHKISSALLSLNDEGILGIKAVNAENQVVFYPAKIAQATADGLWLTELPARLRFITVGQGFVRAGDVVQPILEKKKR